MILQKMLCIFLVSFQVFALEGYLETIRSNFKVGDVVEAQIYVWPISTLPKLEKTLYLGDKAFYIVSQLPIISENNNEVMLIKGSVVFSEAIAKGEKISVKINEEEVPVEMRGFSVIADPEMRGEENLIIQSQKTYSRNNLLVHASLLFIVIMVAVIVRLKTKKKKLKKTNEVLRLEINNHQDLIIAYKKRDVIKLSIGEERYNRLFEEIGEVIFKPSLTSNELEVIKEKFKQYGL